MPFRQAAGVEGFIVLAIIWFVLGALQQAKRKPGASRPAAPTPDEDGPAGSTQREAISLESILREIEKVKTERRLESEPARPPARPPARDDRPAPVRQERPAQVQRRPAHRPASRKPVEQSDRGPMGRHSRTRLPASEEVEERTSLEERGSLELREGLDVTLRSRGERQLVDADDSAEAVVQRRIAAAEARNRPLSESDHQAFHKRLQQSEASASTAARYSMEQLRASFIWREILGPPKALE